MNTSMAFQAERLTDQSFIPPWIRHEHLARYAFASQYVKGKTVVDCACGDGTGSEIFWKAGAQSIAAFDLSEPAVATARARCVSPNVRFQVNDGLKLPLPDRSVDLYISLETIEHIEQDRAFLTEALRVLKPEGIFLCSTPNRAITNPGKSIQDKPWNRFHIREYSKPEFLDLLKPAFNRIELYGQNPQPGWKVSTMEALGKILPGHGAVQLNQIMKLPWLLLDRLKHHTVQTQNSRNVYEYLLAVCREPK